jgi:hypothetical protein
VEKSPNFIFVLFVHFVVFFLILNTTKAFGDGIARNPI